MLKFEDEIVSVLNTCLFLLLCGGVLCCFLCLCIWFVGVLFVFLKLDSWI